MRSLLIAGATAVSIMALPGVASAQMEDATYTEAQARTPTQFVSNPVVQDNLQPTAQATYPVCKGKIQDNCINPRAAGKHWGNRPLNYWPGKPASEM